MAVPFFNIEIIKIIVLFTKSNKGFRLKECESCPLVVEVESLKQEQKRLSMEVGQIKTETRQNEMTITRISSDLSLHMVKTEEANKGLFALIENLSQNLKEYKENETKNLEIFKNHVDEKVNPIVEKLKPFDSMKIQNKIMWSIWVSLGGAAIAIIIFIAQQTYEKYTEEEKQQYYEKRIKESQTIQNIKEKIE